MFEVWQLLNEAVFQRTSNMGVAAACKKAAPFQMTGQLQRPPYGELMEIDSSFLT